MALDHLVHDAGCQALVAPRAGGLLGRAHLGLDFMLASRRGQRQALPRSGQLLPSDHARVQDARRGGRRQQFCSPAQAATAATAADQQRGSVRCGSDCLAQLACPGGVAATPAIVDPTASEANGGSDQIMQNGGAANGTANSNAKRTGGVHLRLFNFRWNRLSSRKGAQHRLQSEGSAPVAQCETQVLPRASRAALYPGIALDPALTHLAFSLAFSISSLPSTSDTMRCIRSERLCTCSCPNSSTTRTLAR